MQDGAMRYPNDFPEHLKPPVDSAIAQAEIDFLQARTEGKAVDYSFSEIVDGLIYRYIHGVVCASAYQACRAFEEGAWNGERVRSAMDEFLTELIRKIYHEKHPNPGEFSHGKFWENARRSTKNSDDWRKIQAELKRVAEQ